MALFRTVRVNGTVTVRKTSAASFRASGVIIFAFILAFCGDCRNNKNRKNSHFKLSKIAYLETKFMVEKRRILKSQQMMISHKILKTVMHVTA